MSLYDYRESAKLASADTPFYAFIMAAMRKADDRNLVRLKMSFPEVWDELESRYHAPNGEIPGDEGYKF